MRERTVRKIEKNDFIDDRRVFDHGVEGPFQKSELTGSLSQHAPFLCTLDHREEGPFRKIGGLTQERTPMQEQARRREPNKAAPAEHQNAKRS
jgi:hypothetical protein